MIRQLNLHNFKCFSTQSIKFRALTLLTGANATGKSTVIQALLLLRQAFIAGDLTRNSMRLNGELISIGEAKDARHDDAADDVISFEIFDESSASHLFAFEYERGKPESRILTATSIANLTTNIFQPQFSYLSAERLGPRVSYPISEDTRRESNVGLNGQFTAYYLDQWGTEDIAIPKIGMPSESDSMQLQHQAQLWMRFIAPDLQFETQRMSEADTVRMGFKNHGRGNYLRPTNMGFGVSYALPIVVAVLVAKPGTMVIVENPEAHLHPRAQSRIGTFLSMAAAHGLQIVVETHSDHTLNGIRLAAKRAIIGASDIAIQFFIREENESTHSVATLDLDSYGRIDEWPPGFFDQSEKDLLELL